MKDYIHLIENKKLKKMLRNKDFVFCMIAYPIVLVLFIVLKIYVYSLLKDNSDFEEYTFYYTGISFLLLFFVAIMSLFERVEKRYLHKVQGDKLKIKQKEGSWIKH